jgi:ABC-type glycerol-3-phosphate transport system substrate-binding protein
MLYNLAGDYSFARKLKSGQLKWNGPEVTRVLNWWKSLIDAGYYHEGSYAFTIEQMRDAFIEQKAAMMVEGAWVASTLEGRAKFDVGWFAMPNENKRNTTIVGGAGNGFNGKTKYPEAVTKYMRFILSDNEATRWQLKARSASTTTKIAIPVEMSKLAAQQYELSKQWGLNSLISLEGLTGDNQMPSGFLTTLEKAMQNIFVGASVSSELDKVEKEFRDLLAAQK